MEQSIESDSRATINVSDGNAFGPGFGAPFKGVVIGYEGSLGLSIPPPRDRRRQGLLVYVRNPEELDMEYSVDLPDFPFSSSGFCFVLQSAVFHFDPRVVVCRFGDLLS